LDGGNWGPNGIAGSWENLEGEALCDTPTVVSWGPDRLDLFITKSDSSVHVNSWDGLSWSGWTALDKVVAVGQPKAVCWGKGRIDLFVKGKDSGVWHNWYDGGSWATWESLGCKILYEPEAVSWGPNRLDVFVVGTDGELHHKWWDRHFLPSKMGWEPRKGWESQGGAIKASPTAVCWGPHRIDVFVIGKNYAVFHKWFDGKSWSPDYEKLGGVSTSRVA
jgi:hypothetical protein